MSEVTVRPARADEVKAVLAMYEWLFESPGYVPPQWDPDTAASSLRAAIASEQSEVLLAEMSGGQLVGIVSAYLDLPSVRFGQRCWVEDLAVDPSRRSQGIGKRLLEEAKTWARSRGATHMRLETGLARIDAQRFYDREEPDTRAYSYCWLL